MTSVGVPGGALLPLVGRRTELAELRRRLPAERLVTLTGEPGCGTSTLAFAAAADFARALQERSALLVLDGCERHVDACAALVDAVLAEAPSVRVLVTSRRVLGVRGETVVRVGPLSLPAEVAPRAEQALASEAVALFVDRATEARRTFRLHDDNAAAVAAICSRLEGNALAITLAAARVSALSPEDLLRRLDDAFRLLTKAPPEAPDRHRSLAASVELSHSLCSPEEQTLWGRLATFAGSVDLEGVEQVCSGEGIDEHDVLDLVDGLLEKGVLLRDESDA